jgi:hypothetical protein
MSEIFIDHLLIKELNRNNVIFPVSKKEISEKMNNSIFRLSREKTVNAVVYLEKIEPEYFENGAAFFCAFHSACYQDIKNIILDEKNRANIITGLDQNS